MKHTWSADVRVVTRGRRAISHGGGSREGWTRTMGTRGCRGVSRDGSDVCSVRESRTITLKVRRRASAGHSRVQGGESRLLRRL